MVRGEVERRRGRAEGSACGGAAKQRDLARLEEAECGRCTRASTALELLLDTEEAGDRAGELGAAELAAGEARGGEAEKATGSWKKMVAA